MKKDKNKKFSKFQTIFDFKWLFYDFVKLTAIIPALIAYRPKYYYINKEVKKDFKHNPTIIASNHNSLKDPLTMLIMFYYRRVGIIGTKELFNTRFKKALFTGFNCIKIDKDNVSLQTFRQVNETIRRGHSVVIFPEGTIAHDKNEIAEFKSGVILMAKMAKSDIYPVYIVKRNHWYERKKLIIGEKFDITSKEKLTNNDMNNLAIELREKMIELEKYSHNIIKKPS